jgi:hypothetical protein
MVRGAAWFALRRTRPHDWIIIDHMVNIVNTPPARFYCRARQGNIGFTHAPERRIPRRL